LPFRTARKYLSSYVSRIISETKLPFLEKHESRISAHNFRHHFAIFSAQNGAPIYYISRTLGHESIKTTELYLEKHIDKENNVAHFWDQNKF
jgi:integrase/recombinase XerD